MSEIGFGNVVPKFHLRNLLGHSGLHLQIIYAHNLLVVGFVSCLVALVLKVLKQVALLHTYLDARLYASRIRLLFGIPCIGFVRVVSKKITILLQRWSLQLCWLYIRLLKCRQAKLFAKNDLLLHDDMLLKS